MPSDAVRIMRAYFAGKPAAIIASDLGFTVSKVESCLFRRGLKVQEHQHRGRKCRPKTSGTAMGEWALIDQDWEADA